MDKWDKLKTKIEQRLKRFPTDITLIWILAEMEFFELEAKLVCESEEE